LCIVVLAISHQLSAVSFPVAASAKIGGGAEVGLKADG
jgi:hypothetical protein